MNDPTGRVQPRRNITENRPRSRWKRYEAIVYWAGLTVSLALIIWFLVASAGNSSDAKDAERTVVATLFVPETQTAQAEGTPE